MPALTSLPASSSGVASLASTMRSTVPNSPRTTRPSSAGSAAKTLARAIAASSSRRASRTASRSAPGHQRHVARQHEDLDRRRRERRRGLRPSASPVPRGSSWSAKSARSAKASTSAIDRRRVDDDRVRAGGAVRRCSPRRRGRRRASGGRTARGGPWAASTSSGFRGRPPARRRPCRSTTRDLGGSRGAAPSGVGRGAGVAPGRIGVRARGIQQSSVGRGIVGAAR